MSVVADEKPLGVPDQAVPTPPPEPEPPPLAEDERLVDGRRVMTTRYGPFVVEPFRQAEGRYKPQFMFAPGYLARAADGSERLVTQDLNPPSAQAECHARATEGRRWTPLEVFPRDAAADEVEALEREGRPALAALLRERHGPAARDPRLEALGAVRVGFRRDDPLGPALALELVGRHAGGDWGVNGRADATELDDDRREFPMLFGPDVRNAASLERKAGVVRSEYQYVVRPGAGLEPLEPGASAAGRGDVFRVRVDTYHLPNRVETYVYTV